MSRRALVLGLIAVALTIATLAVSLTADRFGTVGGELLADPVFARAEAAWTLEGDRSAVDIADGGVVLSLVQPGVLLLQQTIVRPPGVDHLMMSARVRLAGVRAGGRAWHGAGVLLVQHDAAGRARWEFPHALLMKTGEMDWQPLQARFFVPPETERVRVVFGLNAASGMVALRGLSLVGQAERPGYTLLRAGLALAWLCLAVVAGVAVQRGRGRASARVGVLLVAGCILFGGLLPHTAKSGLSEAVRDWRAQLSAPPAPSVTPVAQAASTVPDGGSTAGWTELLWTYVHKGGHVALFAALVLAAASCWRTVAWWRLAGLLVAFAVAAETLQQLTADRWASPRDVGFNLLGVAIGLIMAAGIGAWRRQAGGQRVPETSR